MSKITHVQAREILDSRGNPTVEAEVKTSESNARFSVPSGASTGSHEALELRDENKRFLGKGVQKAVANVNDVIADQLVGMECSKQREIDDLLLALDGTDNKSRLGANALLAVSGACCKAGAYSQNKPVYSFIRELYRGSKWVLPVPQLNVINGGKHAGQKNDIQEHMIMPVGASTFSEGLRMAAEIYQILKEKLHKRFGSTGTLIGDEGGFAPSQLGSVQERFDMILSAVNDAGYSEKTVKLAVDSASSEFYQDGVYTIGGNTMNSGELVDYYAEIVDSYPVISWEDGMAEDDWDGWVEMTKELGEKIQIVGDDLYVTNPKRLEKGIDLNASNSILIKMNQIGTISETIETVDKAHRNKWTAVCSHRSGETEDPFLADLVVGVSAEQIKTGAPARSERLAKYNQLLRIEEELGDRGKYLGKQV